MTITSSTFISDSVLFIRNLLRTNLTDPISRGSGNIHYIFTSFPKDNTQYPLVVVKNTSINTNKLGISSEVSWVNAKYEIKVYSLNSKEVDNITQQIIDLLRTNQFGTGGTSEEQLFGFRLESVVPLVDAQAEQPVHMKTLTFVYNNILT